MGLPPSTAKGIIAASILQACERRVSQTLTQANLDQAGTSREALVEHIARIISRNLASGRMGRVIGAAGQGDLGVPPDGDDMLPAPDSLAGTGQMEAYVDRVITHYLQEHRRVEGLAAQHDAEWAQLVQQLAGRAYHMLVRMQVPSARALSEAAEFAQVSCEAIFSHPFPYDVPFDAWATRILKNCILQRYTRSQDMIDRQPEMTSLDRPGLSEAEGDFSLYDLLADTSGIAAFERIEVREWLIQAIAHLHSQAQQQVIVDTFFYELSDEEIAARLGKTKNAVQILRHRALRRLKQILAKTERKKGW